MFSTKKMIAGGIALMACIGVSAAQSQQPTKTAPTAGIDSTWQNGLSNYDIRLVNSVTRNRGDQDRWMVWTAIVRNREASRDMYMGEPLTTDKVLANVRVRMSVEESARWTSTWSHLSSWDRGAIVQVLRDDLARKH